MPYVDQGIDQRPEVVQGATNALVYWAKDNGAPLSVDADSAFVTLKDNGGTTLLARTAATIAANGKLSISNEWVAATWQLQEDACAVWEWAVSGVQYADRQFFDVVLKRLMCPIDTSDLLDEYPDLEKHLQAIGETDTTKFIKRAWSKILNRIRSGHNRPSLILDTSRLTDPAIEMSLYLACRALIREPDDVWSIRMRDHKEEYKVAIAAVGELKYDRNEDGVAEQGEVKRINRRKFTV
jgi:hypothetical protein